MYNIVYRTNKISLSVCLSVPVARSPYLYLSILEFNHDINRLTGWKTCKNGLNEFLHTVIESQKTT